MNRLTGSSTTPPQVLNRFPQILNQSLEEGFREKVLKAPTASDNTKPLFRSVN